MAEHDDDTGGAEGDAPPAGAADTKLSIYRPDGLPDHLAGASDTATIDALFKAYSGARTELSTRVSAPETVDGYALTFADDAPDHLKTLTADDPAIKMARDLALKHKFTPAQFGFVSEFMGEAMKAGMMDAPLDLKAEMTAFGGADAFEKARGAITAQVETLKTRGLIGGAEIAELQMITSTSAGLKLMTALRAGGPSALNTDGTPASGVGFEDVKARMADPRYSTRSPKYDASFRDQTSEMLKDLEARGGVPKR